MKRSVKTKNSSKARGKIGFLSIIRTYFSVIRLVHRSLGTPRIIVAYLFVVFALFSLLFTVRLPVTSNFLSPTGWAKAQSRTITGFMMIINIVVYGVIMNWRKVSAFRTAIRIALIGSALYLDMLLIRVMYILISDGIYF